MENIKSIKKYAIFKNLDENEVQAMLRCFNAHITTYQKGITFIHKGDKINFFYVVNEGIARTHITDLNGNINTILDYQDSDIIGLSTFLSGKKTYQEDFTAETDIQVILVDSFRFVNPCQNFCPRHSKVLINISNILAKKNESLTDRVLELTKHTTKEKIMSFLENFSEYKGKKEFDIPYTHQELASRLGLERSALSKELSNLQKENAIQYKGKHFKLL